MSGSQRLAPSTFRGYHLTLRMFCDYLTDARYDWPRPCRDRFDQVPTQVCHEWNTIAHLNDYEGRPGRRPFTYDELQVLFDYLDERVERVAGSGRKGALAAVSGVNAERHLPLGGDRKALKAAGVSNPDALNDVPGIQTASLEDGSINFTHLQTEGPNKATAANSTPRMNTTGRPSTSTGVSRRRTAPRRR